MARKHLQKRLDDPALAKPNQNNDKFVHAALFKVTDAGAIQSDPGKYPFSPFLLNPDAIEDNKSGNWVENSIPGQSDPIMQWVSGGARNLSFTALVTKDTVHYPNAGSISDSLKGAIADTALTAVGSIASSFAGVNIPPVGDVISALVQNNNPALGEELSIAPYLDYYRSLMYPIIGEDGVLKSSPPLVVLAMGKTLSSFSGRGVTGVISSDNTDLWITKNISIKVTKWHSNLCPLEAEVAFQFVQYSIKSRSSNSFDITDSGSEPSGNGAATGFLGSIF